MAEKPTVNEHGDFPTPVLVPQGHHLGKPPIPLTRPATLIGGRHNAHIHLVSRKISKAHALIVNDNGHLYLRDLASRTHTFVNGRQVHEVELQSGDTITVGSFKFRVLIKQQSTTKPRRAPAASLQSDDSPLPVPIENRVVLIGRRDESDIALLEPTVSTSHAVIYELGAKRFIRDLGSRTGTFVNGRNVRKQQLGFGDEVRIGDTSMRYIAADSAAPAIEDDASEDLDVSALLAAPQPDISEDQTPASEIALDDTAIELAGDHEPALNHAPPAPAETDRPADEISLDDEPDIADKDGTVALDLAMTHAHQQMELSDQVVDEVDIREQDQEDTPHSFVAEDLAVEQLSSSATQQQPVLSDESEEPEHPSIEPLTIEPPTEELPPATQLPTELPSAGPPAAEPSAKQAPNELLSAGPEQVSPESPSAGPSTGPSAGQKGGKSGTGKKKKKRSKSTAAQAPIQDQPDSQPVVPLADGFDNEVIESTEPSPQSALDLDQIADLVSPMPLAEDEGLTDTVFGRQIEALSQSATSQDSLVEADDTSDTDDASSDTSHAPSPLQQHPAALQGHPDQADASQSPGADAPDAPSADLIEPLDLSADPDIDLPELPDEDISAESIAPIAFTDEPEDALPPIVPDIEQEIATGRAVTPFDKIGLGQPDEPDESEPLHAHDPLDDDQPALPEPPPDHEPAHDPALTLDDAASSPAQTPIADEAADAPIHDAPSDSAPADEAPSPDALIDEVLADNTQTTHEPIGYLGGMPLPLSDALDDLSSHPAAPLQTEAPTPAQTPVAEPQPAPTSDPSATLPPASPPSTDSAPPKPAQSAVSPATPQQPPMVMPPRPRLTGRNTEQEIEDRVFAPFTSESAGDSGVFDGLTQQIDQQPDVFGNLPLPMTDDPVLGRHADLPAETFAGAQPPQADSALPDSAPANTDDDTQPTDPSDSDAQSGQNAKNKASSPDPLNPRTTARRPSTGGPIIPPSAPRKSIIPKLLLLMFLCLGIAAGLIWYLVPSQTRVLGILPFQNADSQSARTHVSKILLDALRSQTLRSDAQAIYRAHSQAGFGFLDDSIRFSRSADDAGFTSDTNQPSPAQWRFAVESEDSSDSLRVNALMRAIYSYAPIANLTGQYKTSIQNIKSFESAIASTQAIVDQRSHEIADLQDMLHGRQTPQSLEPLQQEVAGLEAQWHSAMQRVVRLENELQQMRQTASATIQNTQLPLPDDVQLRNMNATLTDLTTRLDAARNKVKNQADAALAQLDQSIEQLRSQIATVRSNMNGDPALSAYVNAVEQLQFVVQGMTSELLQNQKEQVDRIASLKQLLAEKMSARRNKIWENDKELHELREQLALTTRQYNAALSGGLETAEQASQLQQETEDISRRIDQRRQLLGGDKDYEEAIAQLQQVIDLNQQRLIESRQRVDQTLARMQQSLAAAKPTTDKLPQDQQKLAAELEQRLAAMSEARKKYVAVTDGSVSPDDDQTNLLSQEIATLQQRISDRRKMLTEEQNKQLTEQQELARLRLLESKRNELTEAQAAAQKDSNAYFQQYKSLEDMRTAVKRLADATAQRDTAQNELTQQRTRLQAALAEPPIAYPQEPFVELATIGTDYRPAYTMAASIAIVAIFSLLILLAARQPGRFIGPALTDQIPPAPPIPDTSATLNNDDDPVTGHSDSPHPHPSRHPNTAIST